MKKFYLGTVQENDADKQTAGGAEPTAAKEVLRLQNSQPLGGALSSGEDCFAPPAEATEGPSAPREPVRTRDADLYPTRAEVICEDVESRNENGKLYMQNDGVAKAIFTANAVHYFDASAGEFKEIDNTFVDTGDCVENKANVFKARFSKNPSDGKIYELSKNGSKVTLISQQAAAKGCCNAEICNCNAAAQTPEVTVREVAPGVDVQYLTEADRIKENIIIRERADSYVFDFDLKVENLTPELSEDGKNLELKSLTTGETEFVVPPPFMFDAEGNYSDEVFYEIAQESGDVLTLKVIAAPEFINAENRAFPVVVDPQIISSDSALFLPTYRYKIISGSSGSTTSGWYGPYSGLRAGKTASYEYQADLIVRRSKLNVLDHKIVKATLKIKPSTVYTPGFIDINDSIQKFTDNKEYAIDITDFMRSGNDNFTIPFRPNGNTRADISFYTAGNSAPRIEIEYLTNEKTRPQFETFSLAGGAAEAAVNLLTGDSAVIMDDLKTEGALPITVSHVFKRSDDDFACGRNWRLNLHQTLKKETNSALDSNFVYTDEKGDKHGFKDYYYYFDSQQNKVYVPKSDVAIEYEGKLVYNGREVFKEQKSSLGYKILAKEDGLIDIDLIEQRSEEQIALEDKIESYYNALKDCVCVDTTNGEILKWLGSRFRDGYLSKSDFESFWEFGKSTGYHMILPETEALQLKTLRDQENSSDTMEKVLYHSSKSMEYQIEQLDLTRDTYSYTIEDLSDKHASRSATYNSLKSNATDQKYNVVFQQQDVEKQRKDNNTQKANTNAQILLIKAKKDQYLETYKKYFWAYVRSREELKRLERNTQEYFLLDNDQNVRAFNKFGNLVSIFDFYENVLSVEYDADGKITLVKDGEDKQINFVYKNGLLSSLSDDRGVKISYRYQGESLCGVEASDGTSVKLTYDSAAGQIATVETSALRARLRYANKQLSSVEELSLTDRITKHGAQPSAEKPIRAATLAYDWFRTVVSKKERLSDADTHKNYYVFHADGNLSCRYSEKNGKTEDVLTHDFVDEQCAFTVKAKKGAFNYLKDIPARSASGKLLLKSITAAELQAVKADGSKDDKTTDYMFSGYATSTNSDVTAMRMQTEFYSRSMSAAGAKFELCCELVYPDNEVKTFVNSYDYRNKNKQFIAVPVTLKENENGDAVLPEKVNLYVDRTGNSAASFYTFCFCKADFSYEKLNQFGDPTLSETDWSQIAEDSFVKTETEYTYDDVQKLTKKRTKQLLNINNERTEIYAVEKSFYNTFGKLLRTESYVEGEEQTKGINIEQIEYNDKGMAASKVQYNSLDSSSKYYSERGVSGKDKDKGKDGKEVEPQAKTSEDGYAAGYDSQGNVSAVSMSTDEGEENTTSLSRTLGLVTEVRSGLNAVNYEYDHKARVTAVKLNSDTDYVAYAYGDNLTEDGKRVDKVTATMIDGTVFETVTDADGNVLRRTCGDAAVTLTYDDGKLAQTHDSVTGATCSYEYDSLDRLKKVSGAAVETLTYNDCGKPNTVTVTAGDTVQTYEYRYKNNLTRDLDCVTLPGGLNLKEERDALGRVGSKRLGTAAGDMCGEYYTYRKTGDRATTMPSAVRYGIFENGSYTIREGLKYAYDESGNMTAVYENGALITRYAYDRLSRLVREDNRKLGKTFLTVYDNNGNILARRETGYTLKDTEEMPLNGYGAEVLYGYDGSFGDRLTSFGGAKFVYDLMGNPTYYKADGNAAEPNMGWSKGRQLDFYAPQGKAKVTFGYDGQGNRIRKGNTQYTYLSDGKLLKQTDGAVTLEFIRDGENLLGFRQGGKQYVYRKNVQGDVTHLYEYFTDSLDLRLRACYTYDAWGNHRVFKVNADGTRADITDLTAADNASHIGNVNPIRYRSYYFDAETNLYFLQSRYYDPEIGRFINADDISVLDETALDVNGINLYAYCGNNPVMRVDETGYAWWNWLISGLQILVGGILIATGVGAGFGAMLLTGGVVGMVSNALGSTIGGGLGSMLNGWGAISTGLSLFSFGLPGAILGALAIGVGAVTMALGVNEVVTGITGTNYIQKWTGLSDAAYGALYAGFNIASSVITIAGRLGMRGVGTKTIGSHDVLRQNGQKPYAKIFRGSNISFFDGRGNAYWSKHNIGTSIDGTPKGLHWHTSLGKDGKHIYSYIGLLIKLIFGG